MGPVIMISDWENSILTQEIVAFLFFPLDAFVYNLEFLLAEFIPIIFIYTLSLNVHACVCTCMLIYIFSIPSYQFQCLPQFYMENRDNNIYVVRS